jgi:hypothetical protein
MPRSGALLGAIVSIHGALAAVHAPTAPAAATPNWTGGVEAVLPVDAMTNQSPSLESVSCAAAGSCSAVGSYQDASGHSQGLLLSESSGAWSAGTKAPLPSGAGTDPKVSLSSVICLSADACTAVGHYTDSSADQQGLLLGESSGTWTPTKASLPAGAATNPQVYLNSVSCSSASSCTAVGTYVDVSEHQQGLLLSESSGSWTATKVSPPNDAGANPLVSLRAVSCASAGNCVAIGVYRDKNTYNQVLLVSESAGAWSQAVQPSLPPGGGTIGGHGLSSVSCPSAGNCDATGYYYDSSGHTQGLLLSESSGTWIPTKAPLPADAASIPSPGVDSVSCASAGDCAAAGYYSDTSANRQGLLLSESAGAWSTGIAAPLPPDSGTNPNAYLASIACASASDCSAAGSYSDSSGNGQGMLVSESAGAWSSFEATLPLDAGINPNVEFASVSCASAGNCSAVGSYEDGSGHYPGLIVSAVPASPALTLSAPTTGTVGAALGPSGLAAALSGGVAPIGTLTFTVFGPQASAPGSCASGGTVVGSASVSGNGTYNPPAGFTPTGAGDYWWYASYGGDTGDNPASSACGSAMARTVVGAGAPSSGVPHLTRVSQSHRRWREGRARPHMASAKRPPIGTTFRFTVDQAVRVRFSFRRLLHGRRVKGHCVAPKTRNRNRPRCKRRAAGGARSFKVGAGSHRMRFQGRLSKRKRLKRGRYVLLITATNAAGQSAVAKLTFTIVSGARSRRLR